MIQAFLILFSTHAAHSLLSGNVEEKVGEQREWSFAVRPGHSEGVTAVLES